jgi:putative membrane protein
MKKSIIATLFIAGSLSLSSCANHENDSKEAAEEQNDKKFEDSKMEDDTKFAVNAASGGLMEVQLGQMAVNNGTSPEVKQFGQSMVDEHSKANQELIALAQQKNITLPTAPDEDKQKKIDELSKKSGTDFDKAYIDLMVDDHKEDIDEFQEEANNGKDVDLKGWAAGKVPVLQHHLEMAKAAQDALKK